MSIKAKNKPGCRGRRGPTARWRLLTAWVVLVALVASLVPVTEARAETVVFINGVTATRNADGSITGRCRVFDFIDDLGEVYPVTLPDGQQVLGQCLDYMHYAPTTGEGADGEHDFTATPNGDGTYDVMIHSDRGNPGRQIPGAYEWQSPPQRISLVWTPKMAPPKGHATVVKGSANAAITLENDCYSLVGAEYRVYRDEACTDQATGEAVVVRDAQGNANSVELAPGTYWLKEVKAPKGYRLDATPVKVEVKSGETATATVKETPLADPAEFWAYKYDGDAKTPLEGAEFTVAYYDGIYETADALPEKATRTWVVRTDKDGRAALEDSYKVSGDQFYKDADGRVVAPIGTYAVRETKAPRGYKADTKTNLAHVRDKGDGASVEAYSAPELPNSESRAGVSVQKTDSATGKTAQGDASLEGISFDIINVNDFAVSVGGKEYAAGEAIHDLLVTDKDGMASTAADALPAGTYRIQEAKGNASMKVTAKAVEVTLTASDQGKVVYAGEQPDEVKRGGVRVGKVSSENGAYLPQGAATLAGARFSITNESANPVQVDGKTYAPGDVVKVIATRADEGRYVAETAKDALPYGTYRVTEAAAGEGYLRNGGWSKTFEIRGGAQMVDLTGEADACPDSPVRGGMRFDKVSEETGKPLGGVVFKVTSDTTGEWHLVMADDQGHVDTEAAPHSRETNGNDAALGSDGSLDEGALDPGRGIWFDGRTDAKAEVDDGVAAMPFDTYTVEELRCSANAGHRLVSFQVVVDEDGEDEDLGTIVDRGLPEIGTELAWGDDEHVASSVGTVTLTDLISYRNLDAGVTYTLVGTLMDKATGEPVTDADGEPVTSSREFTAEKATGSVTVEFKVDGSRLAGRTVVAFETLMLGGEVEAEHSDIDDDGQTLRFPDVETELTGEEGEHEAAASETVTLTDTVAYRNLHPGTPYEVTGKLMNKATGEAVTVGGKELTTTATFTPEKPDGTVSLDFTFPGSALAGKTVVAFETVRRDGREVAVHADIEDQDQTVRIPSIGTTLTDQDGHHVTPSAEGEITLTDAVSYQNLKPGATYTVTGTLMDKATGKAVETGDGKAVTASAEFTPEEADGTVEVDFTFPAALVSGRAFVAFEALSRDGRELAVHANINDEGQTVRMPEIGTTLTDAEGAHEVMASEKLILTDTVTYRGLKPGVEYIVTGTLVDKATGEALEADGADLTQSVAFTPEASDGTVEVTFEIDASLMAGRSVVAYERVLHKDRELAVHADIEDDDQTVRIPEVRTNAADAADHDKYVPATGTVSVTDTVSYKNLEPGVEYTLSGTLHVAGTGEDVTIGEAPVTASATFTPEKPEGTTEVTFTFDAEKAGNGTFVVYEALSRGGATVATHEDADDEAQTFRVPVIGTTASDKATKDHWGYAVAEKTTVTDTVSYKNLKPGTEYTVEGTLMDKATGKALQVDGKDVTAKKTFTAEKADGAVELSFEVPTASVTGKTVVAFEKVLCEGLEVAAHADLKDEDQTVRYLKIQTTACDQTTRSHEATNPTGDVTIVDSVNYTGLKPGVEYTLEGRLMDAATGKQVGTTQKVSFKPAGSEGVQKVTFKLKATDVSNKSLVAFEKLYKGETLIAAHEDLKDKDQTVTYKTETPKKETTTTTTGKTMPYTGASRLPYVLLAAGAAVAFAAAVWYVRKRGTR